MHANPRRLRFLPAAALILAAGCEEPRQLNGKAAAKPAPPKDMYIVGKTTQEIGKFDAREETRKGGVVASQKITARDPITLQGNAYVTSIGKISIGQIDYALRLYEAENGRYPKDHQEFMDEIIKKNNVSLPKLPFYQEYKYDEKEHKLLVIEYPDKKAGPLPQ